MSRSSRKSTDREIGRTKRLTERHAIFSVDFWMFLSHLVVQIGPQIKEFERRAKDADAEVVVAWKVLIVRLS